MSIVSSQRKPNTTASDYNSLYFAIWQQLAQVNTLELAVVMAVNADNSVDVKPLLNALNPDDEAVEPAVIYNIPYLRLQAGANAVKIIPQVGDMGLIGYCQRDISSVISSKGQANLQSNRKFSNSDAVYITSVASLATQPVRYLEINDSAITINGDVPLNVTATQATVNAPTTINGDTTINGNLSVNGDTEVDGKVAATKEITTDTEVKAMIDVKAATISLLTHTHPGVTPGNGTTGTPQ